MDNVPNNGSFMANAGGGGSALQQAMARRSTSGGVLNQNTTSPQAVPPAQVGSNTPSALSQPQRMGAPLASPQRFAGSIQGGAGESPVAQQIIKAMGDYLDSIAKINESQVGI